MEAPLWRAPPQLQLQPEQLAQQRQAAIVARVRSDGGVRVADLVADFGVSDMTAGIRDIAAATALPFFADGDDGYGDVKSVARMIELYETVGVGAILIEDQKGDRKQQRADRALGVVDRAVIDAKLRVALAERRSPDTFIIGRTVQPVMTRANSVTSACA